MGATDELIAECERQAENCEYTALTFTLWLKTLRIIETTCTVLPVVCGGLATWSIIQNGAPVFSAVNAFMATIIPPAYKASNANKRIKEYVELSGTLFNLRDRFRQVALISSHKPFPEFEKEAKGYFAKLEQVRMKMLTPPDLCFWLARRKIRTGHYIHDRDAQ